MRQVADLPIEGDQSLLADSRKIRTASKMAEDCSLTMKMDKQGQNMKRTDYIENVQQLNNDYAAQINNSNQIS